MYKQGKPHLNKLMATRLGIWINLRFQGAPNGIFGYGIQAQGFVSMMQVSNFAGPKMGSPKTVIVGILDINIYICASQNGTLPPNFWDTGSLTLLMSCFLKNLTSVSPVLCLSGIGARPRHAGTDCQASPQDLIQLVAQLPSASQEAKQQGLPRSWSKADGAENGEFF